MNMTLILTFVSIIGNISYRINPKLILSILITTISVFVASFTLLIILVRAGMI